jgi:cytoskeletal protein CcmA (bactofilin family)
MVSNRNAAWFRGAGLPVLAAMLLAAIPVAADSSDTGGDDVFRAGSEVRADGPVRGSFYATGGDIDLAYPVAKDAYLAGGDIRVHAPVGGNLGMAGGDLALETSVGGKARLIGGQISVGPQAAVAGSLELDGGQVTMRGKAAQNMTVRAGAVIIDGEIDGDVKIEAREITLRPGALIKGSLTYTSRHEMNLDTGAQVQGAVVHESGPGGGYSRGARSRNLSDISVYWLVVLLASGTVFMLAFPAFVEGAQAELASRGWEYLGVGLAVLLATPVLAVIFAITIIGIPVAVVLVVMFLLLMFLGYVVSAIFIGACLLRAAHRERETGVGWRIGALAIALIALALLRLVPVAGGLVLFLVLVFGIGCCVMRLIRSRSAPPVASAGT